MEWLLFLLPIAAFSGWMTARKQYLKTQKKQQNNVDPNYFKGLNYLLNEQPDKAIDIFIKLLEVNSDTVETHLALASLFRRRGETERAIRIHQNLIARPTLTAAQRDQALIELGLDYMSAGVLDRAESLFLELINKVNPPIEALSQLLDIYQQEKKWLQAIEMAKKIVAKSKQQLDPIIAQFYCELALQESTDKVKALASLKQATKYDANCVRATLLEADLYIDAKHYQRALTCLLNIERQNPHYLGEAFAKLFHCHQQLNSLALFEKWLQQLLLTYPKLTSARLMLTQVIQVQYGGQAAQNYLHQQLPSSPSIEGLHALISLGEAANPILIPLIEEITGTMIRNGHGYSCQSCGFSGKTMYWHCPSCKRWGSIRPTEIHFSALQQLLESSS